MPPAGIIRFLFGSFNSTFGCRFTAQLLPALNYCADRCQSSQNEGLLNRILYNILRDLGTIGQLDWSAHQDFFEKIYQIAMTCNTPDLLNLIKERASRSIPLTTLSWSRKQFEMSKISFERLSIGFVSLYRFLGTLLMHTRLIYAVLTHNSLSERYQAVLAFHGDTDPNDDLVGLLKNTATTVLKTWRLSGSTYEDGLALFDLVMYYADDCSEVMKSS